MTAEAPTLDQVVTELTADIAQLRGLPSTVRSLQDEYDQPLGTWRQQAKVFYFGGYYLPNDPGYPNDPPLPDDLQQAATEQVAAWFLNRDKLGLIRQWPHGGVYEVFSQLPLLPFVEAVLKHYTRWSI